MQCIIKNGVKYLIISLHLILLSPGIAWEHIATKSNDAHLHGHNLTSGFAPSCKNAAFRFDRLGLVTKGTLKKGIQVGILRKQFWRLQKFKQVHGT